MDLTGYVNALNNYIAQAKEAEKNGEDKKASNLYASAAEIAATISKETMNTKVKSQYFEIAEQLIKMRDSKMTKTEGGDYNSQGSDSKLKSEPEQPLISKEEALEKLHSLIGLESVKSKVQLWTDALEGLKILEEAGEKVDRPSYHMVFTGSPGTGKTTVARILGHIFRAMGLVSKGQLVEVERADLVAMHVGETAIKTNAVIEKALGGILFIDEAYSLTKGGSSDFGGEAISTLLTAMENHRHDFVVIVAGYENEMKGFIASNPGLKSRFVNFFNFEDYSSKQLMDIFMKMLGDFRYKLDAQLEPIVAKYFDDLVAHKERDFGNARVVRNFVQKLFMYQNSRLAISKRNGNPVSNNQLKNIIREDLEKALADA